MPETFDLIDLNSPRIFDGASGFGSQISIWLGPPWRKSMITDLALPQPVLTFPSGPLLAACNRKISPRLSPRTPAPPIRKNSRRLNPSHVLPVKPGIDNINFAPIG